MGGGVRDLKGVPEYLSVYAPPSRTADPLALVQVEEHLLLQLVLAVPSLSHLVF